MQVRTEQALLSLRKASAMKVAFAPPGRLQLLTTCPSSPPLGRICAPFEATRRFTIDQHRECTRLVECRKDETVMHVTPLAFRSMGSVVDAQSHVVDKVNSLQPVLSVNC
mmetsp:Transcript_10494/g.32079  ORF Transcript_10494/g.32079 Transcript_10494/m.32079 type:complete len:110 (+) Transcript_10494:179-508(+)